MLYSCLCFCISAQLYLLSASQVFEQEVESRRAIGDGFPVVKSTTHACTSSDALQCFDQKIITLEGKPKLKEVRAVKANIQPTA